MHSAISFNMHVYLFSGTFGFVSDQLMAPPLKTGSRNISYTFLNPNLDSLECLVKKITPDETTKFREKYGYILSLLKMPFTKYEQEGIHTLLHFYTPSPPFFPFPDSLLVPHLEKFFFFPGFPTK